MMNTLSLCTIALIVVVFLRYVCLFELEAAQKKIYMPNKLKSNWFLSYLKHSGTVWMLVIEIIVILPHPCSFLVGYKF